VIPALGRGRIHLLGVCGTGMASLAGMLKEKGFAVSGSDQNVYPPMSDMLAELGIEVRSPYSAENLPSDADLIVVGNALSRGNPELEEVLDRGMPYASMAEVVKEVFIRGKRSVVVAGTHGKTTTTSLVAWILERGGTHPGFLVGGIPKNFSTSYRVGEGGIFVIEGDEYDTAYFDKGPKFLHYLPEVVVLGNVEYDHADIYSDMTAVTVAFERLVNLIPRRGLLIVGAESPAAKEIAVKARCRVESFSVTGSATWRIGDVESTEVGQRFTVVHDGLVYGVMEGPFWGRAAVRNALAAVAVGHWFGLGSREIAAGMRSFQGVRRRLEVLAGDPSVTVVDDFAHHPTAIRETLHASRLRWPGRRLWAVFEPRSYTARSKTFQHEMPDALQEADRVVLAAVYSSARLPREQELSVEKVVDDLRQRGLAAWFFPTVDEIVAHLASHVVEGDVVLIMSNGDFGGLHQKLLYTLGRKQHAKTPSRKENTEKGS
jgi:UDP-N-acetylmuramate: L-alanyl-gamma-D-glutamyl-meso-diaminopimelate ligase